MMALKLQDDPFFIVGCARSGTTLFRTMINEHPRLRVPHESFFITDLLNHLPLTSPLTEDDKHQAFHLISNSRYWKRFYLISNHITAKPEQFEETTFKSLTEEKLRDIIFSLQEPLLSELIDAVFRQCINLEGKPRWGDKTPQYVKEIDQLHQVFPKAKFLHIIRDVRDVCLSHRNIANWKKPFIKTANQWSHEVCLGIESGQKLGPDLYLEIRYEDLVLKTEETLKQTCAFLGEEYSDKMLRFYENAAKEVESVSAFSKNHRPPQPSDVYRWRSEMNPLEIARVEMFAGKTMDRIGQNRYFRGPLQIFPYSLRTFDRVYSFPGKIKTSLKSQFSKA